jgi:hypothetical protein
MLAMAAFVASLAPTAQAATCTDTWTGMAGDGQWTTAANWSTGSVPGSADVVCIGGTTTYTVTLAGNSPDITSLELDGTSGTQTLQVEATDNCGGASSAILSMSAGGSVDAEGKIEMTQTGTCHSGVPELEMTGGTLTNRGTIQTDAGNATGTFDLDGGITNQGVININTLTDFGANITNATLDNRGQINTTGSVQLVVASGSSSIIINDAGGIISNGGASSDTGGMELAGGSTFVQGAGTTNPSGFDPANPAVLMLNSALEYNGGGSSSIQFRGAGDLTGNLAADQELTLAATDFCGGATNAVATASGSFTNAGTIEMTQINSGCHNGIPELEIPTGTLTNTGTLQLDLGGASSAFYLDGNITNQGQINVNTNTDYGQIVSGAILDNKRQLAIATGQQLLAVSGRASTIINDTGGSITNNGGTGSLYVDSSNTYDQGAGTTSPSSSDPSTPAVTLNNSTLNYTGSGASAIDYRGAGHLSGNLAAGQNLDINATDFCSGAVNAVATASGSFTNAGTIEMTHIGSCGNGTDSLVLPAADTLTNSSSGIVSAVSGTASTGRTIGSAIDNSGTVDAQIPLTVQGDLDQSAGITSVASGSTLTPTAMTLTGGTLTGAGTVAGTSVTNTSGTVQPGSLTAPATLTISGPYSQGSGGTLAVPDNGPGAGQASQLDVGAGSGPIKGVLRILPTSSYAPTAAPGDTIKALVSPGVTPDLGPPRPTNTVAPSISGTPAVGNTLTCNPGTWANAPTSFSYQWQRDGSDISGATASTYTVQTADDGHGLTCVVTGIEHPLPGNKGFEPANAAGLANAVVVNPYPDGTGTATSAAANVVTTPKPTTPPSITGTPAVGRTLVCARGTWSFTPTSYAYQWNRDGNPIPGATHPQYTITRSDAGHTLSCRVTASNGRGSASATTTTVSVPAPPVEKKNVDVLPVSGTIRIKLPGSDHYVVLRAGERIPLGTLVDATHGQVQIVSAKNRRGITTTGIFYAGIFRITQAKGARVELTVLTLAGPGPTGCTFHDVLEARRRGHRTRSLWGHSRGAFKTVGNYASATERGTTWLTEDSCDGTRIRVTQDSVTVHDFPHHRTFVLRAGHSFTAHPGKGG